MDSTQNIKEGIINASKYLFYEYGFHKTTIRMIAKEVGIFHSNIFYYYKSKREILKIILKEFFQNLHEIIMKFKLDLTNQELLLYYDMIIIHYLEYDNKFKNLYYESTDIVIEVLYENYVQYLYPVIDTDKSIDNVKKQNEYMMDIITILAADREINKLREYQKFDITIDENKEYLIKLNLRLLGIDLNRYLNNKGALSQILEVIDFNQLNIFKNDYKISIE